MSTVVTSLLRRGKLPHFTNSCWQTTCATTSTSYGMLPTYLVNDEVDA